MMNFLNDKIEPIISFYVSIHMAKSRETKENSFIKRPYYEGGIKALRQFIRENMQYPKAALKAKIEGTVYLRYTVDYKGNVVSVKVKSSLGHGCDEEAIRLVKLLKFKVDKVRKVRVQFHKTIQIHFKLPKVKPAPKPKPQPPSSATSLQVTYNYTAPKKTPPKKDPPKKSGGYTITISY